MHEWCSGGKNKCPEGSVCWFLWYKLSPPWLISNYQWFENQHVKFPKIKHQQLGAHTRQLKGFTKTCFTYIEVKVLLSQSLVFKILQSYIIFPPSMFSVPAPQICFLESHSLKNKMKQHKTNKKTKYVHLWLGNSSTSDLQNIYILYSCLFKGLLTCISLIQVIRFWTSTYIIDCQWVIWEKKTARN